MSVLVKDESLIASLSAMSSPSELHTPDGKVLGRFIPSPGKGKMSYPEFGMTDEELDARASRPDAKWYSADEVMARLRELTKDS
jgi:hypothetical protein